MDAKTAAQLIALNRRFYGEVAPDFDASRADPWPGWRRVLACVEPGGDRPAAVLDIGCGNGRLIEALRERFDEAFEYHGVDFARELLDRARERHGRAPHITFSLGDVLDPRQELPRAASGFDLVALFGVLHHVPGEANRRSLIARLGERLRPGGVLALTAWQFADRARFQARSVPLAHYNAGAEEPIDPAQLDSGDHLLRFGDAPFPRYCHHTTADELDSLLAPPGYERIAAYRDDGKTGDLNLYAIVRRTR